MPECLVIDQIMPSILGPIPEDWTALEASSAHGGDSIREMRKEYEVGCYTMEYPIQASVTTLHNERHIVRRTSSVHLPTGYLTAP